MYHYGWICIVVQQKPAQHSKSNFSSVKNTFKKRKFPHMLTLTLAPHSSTLAWKIPWMEEPGRLQSMGSRRIRHD